MAVHIAAHDRRINDGSWKALDAGRKELLLPLGDEPSMPEAAQHVLATKLSHEATRQYVASLREAAGRPRAARFTGPRVASRLRRLRESMGSASARRGLERLAREAEGEDRHALVTKVDGILVRHRLGGSLNPHIHDHLLLMHGVHVSGGEENLRFQPTPPRLTRRCKTWLPHFNGG